MGRLQIDPLEDSRERLQAALDASKTGTWRWDIPANTLDWDDNLNRLFGLPAGRSVPTLDDFIALVHSDDRAMVDEACQRSIKDGTETTLDTACNGPTARCTGSTIAAAPCSTRAAPRST